MLRQTVWDRSAKCVREWPSITSQEYETKKTADRLLLTCWLSAQNYKFLSSCASRVEKFFFMSYNKFLIIKAHLRHTKSSSLPFSPISFSLIYVRKLLKHCQTALHFKLFCLTYHANKKSLNYSIYLSVRSIPIIKFLQYNFYQNYVLIIALIKKVQENVIKNLNFTLLSRITSLLAPLSLKISSYSI